MAAFPLAVVQIAWINFSSRHIPVIEPVKESAGSRHAWWLTIGWITQWEEAILWALAGIGQISDALRADRLRESLSLPGGIMKIGC